MPAPPVPPPKSSSSRNRRGGGGRSRPSAQDAASVDGDEGEETLSAYLNSCSLTPCPVYSWRRSFRAEQPTFRGWSLKSEWLAAQPKHGRPSAEACEWHYYVRFCTTGFFHSNVFIYTATTTAPADIVGSARLSGTFGTYITKQDPTTTTVTWIGRGTWCASSVAGEAHECR